MRATGLLGLAALLAACSVKNNGGAGSDAGTTPPPSATDAGSADAPTGAGCGTDPNTGATLCLAISSCPTLAIDPRAYPDCGFRLLSGVIDIECSCSGELCPLGVATSCAEAQKLLAEQNEGVVCQQIVEGRCTAGAPAGQPEAGPTSTCDPSCRDTCVGDPTCIELCGC